MNVLFVCARNRLRSPTAERVFAGRDGLDCDSAGLAPDADTVLSAEQVEWADVVMVMERSHRTKLSKRYAEPLRGKRVVVLGIPDDYALMDPALIRLLEAKVPPLLR